MINPIPVKSGRIPTMICHHNFSLNPFIPFAPPPAEYNKYIENATNENPKIYYRIG